MHPYRFMEHTADAKYQAFGQSLEEAFGNAALALVSLMWDRDQIRGDLEYEVQVRGTNQYQLLLVFLEEVLYLLDTKGFLVKEVKDIRIQEQKGEYALTAIFVGDKISEDHCVYGEVKAITYNEMKIEKKERFVVQVVVDI